MNEHINTERRQRFETRKEISMSNFRVNYDFKSNAMKLDTNQTKFENFFLLILDMLQYFDGLKRWKMENESQF